MRDQRKDVLEIVGIIAVVLSFAFVGYEIRQNTIASRAAAYQAIGIAIAAAFDNEAHDRSFAILRQKEADDMDATDWQQLAAKMTGIARLGETVLLQVEQGLLPPDALDRLGFRGWKEIFEVEDPKNAYIWPLIRPGVSSSFREFVESHQSTEDIDCSSFDIP